jgi:biotin synthase
MSDFFPALRSVLAGKQPAAAAITALLSAREGEAEELFAAADAARRAGVGDEVHLRAIIEFSNHCRQNCLYCGLRRDNRAIARYRLDREQIMAAVDEAASLGFKTVVLQSGEDVHYTAGAIARLVESIKRKYNLAVTLSVGQRRRLEYALWRQAGADRYLLKHETADEELFRRLKPGSSLAERLRCLYWLKELGYQVGSGNMVGLPGQSLEALAKDIILLRELAVEMAGVGPFLPHQNTPLKDAPPGSLELTRKVLAVTRLCLPRAHLPATTSLSTLSSDGRRLALVSGANVVMPNLTPPEVKGKYLIYPQKADITERPRQALDRISLLLAGMNRPIARGCGHAIKYVYIQ